MVSAVCETFLKLFGGMVTETEFICLFVDELSSVCGGL